MWREWAKPNLEQNKFTPGTVKSYFSSVGKFLKFIINKVADETKDFPNIDERSLRLANNGVNRLPDWRTAISRKFSHKKWEKVLQVSRRLPPPSTINYLMSTAPAKEAIQILNKSSTGHLVSLREFLTVQDFLIDDLSLKTCKIQVPWKLPHYLTSNRLRRVMMAATTCIVRSTNDPWMAQPDLYGSRNLHQCKHLRRPCALCVPMIRRKPCL